ncbi:hypothetical protein B0H17DRAFT_1197027 [Mycena rosella]|uniref:Uncharacterized protein n=1 Tax=Mycena rosella TaxID=1033263 RepID=A0AAD7DSI3_MYCRO|nr:hypothetical protein B0H17DRAFT_1197027 [Mycena rosella]
MGDEISGMYPTLIIVIVNLHQTIWDAPSYGETKHGSTQFTSRKRIDHSATFRSARAAIIHLDTQTTSTDAITAPEGEERLVRYRFVQAGEFEGC